MQLNMKIWIYYTKNFHSNITSIIDIIVQWAECYWHFKINSQQSMSIMAQFVLVIAAAATAMPPCMWINMCMLCVIPYLYAIYEIPNSHCILQLWKCWFIESFCLSEWKESRWSRMQYQHIIHFIATNILFRMKSSSRNMILDIHANIQLIEEYLTINPSLIRLATDNARSLYCLSAKPIT